MHMARAPMSSVWQPPWDLSAASSMASLQESPAMPQLTAATAATSLPAKSNIWVAAGMWDACACAVTPTMDLSAPATPCPPAAAGSLPLVLAAEHVAELFASAAVTAQLEEAISAQQQREDEQRKVMQALEEMLDAALGRLG